MEFYWSHYAKVMEFNRHRILLQKPNEMNFFDVPQGTVLSSSQRRSHSVCSFTNCQPPQSAYAHTQARNICSLTNSQKIDNNVHKKYTYLCRTSKKRKGKKARKRQKRLDKLAYRRSEDQSGTMETEDNVNKSDLEFVIDDGFMKFLEISMEHKLERKKRMLAEKQREALKREEDLAKGTNLAGVQHEERKAYKSQVYGEHADKIMAMENAMDINLNQQKDLYQPVLWPNLALNLKF